MLRLSKFPSFHLDNIAPSVILEYQFLDKDTYEALLDALTDTLNTELTGESND